MLLPPQELLFIMSYKVKEYNPRIVAGLYKGRRLKVPDSARPYTDRIKTTIFDILTGEVQGKKCLDMFAGSGSVGIEALSRGAAEVTFVDANIEAIETIRINLGMIGASAQAKVIQDSYLKFVNHSQDEFDLIFLDPPFEMNEKFKVDAIRKVLTKDGLVVCRIEDSKEKLKARELEILDTRKIGRSIVYFLKRRTE
jgi:16S rRNA (guanine966-N2)-methyltransferase